jgi:DNA invertase Pin-like site-specific DNA recombinase
MCGMGLLLGYVRVSTTDQHGQMQFDALVEAGVPEEHIYFDQLSGAKAAKERPGLTALLCYARREDTVLAYRIDRLGRSLTDVLNTVAEMQERGLGLRSLVDGVDPSTASGRLQLGLFATLAEYEGELINERVRAGVMAAKARGVKFGQKPVKQETVEAKLEVARRLLYPKARPPPAPRRPSAGPNTRTASRCRCATESPATSRYLRMLSCRVNPRGLCKGG